MNPGKEDVVSKIKEMTGDMAVTSILKQPDIHQVYSRDWTVSVSWDAFVEFLCIWRKGICGLEHHI